MDAARINFDETGYGHRMEFRTTDRGDLGAPILDVAQEAVDATSTRYTRTPDIDVEQTLREHLHGRGVTTTDDVVARIAEQIRSGHEVRIGAHDGSIDRSDT